MDLLALADFNLVATEGGIGRASRGSGRPKATLSRRIRELEESLDVRLVERGSRSLRLTEEGAALHARTQGLLAEIVEAGKSVGAARDRPRGRLRISAPVLFCNVAMGRISADFVRVYPDVRIEVIAEDRPIDLIEEGYDLAIRINPRPNDDLVGRCFLRDRRMIVASASVPRPQAGADSERGVSVPAVIRATPPETEVWRFVAEGRQQSLIPEPILRLSSFTMVQQATLAGAGVAMLPESMVAPELAAQRLVCWGIVPDRPVEIWALHTSRRLASRKVTAFIQFLCDAFPDGSLR